MKQITVILLLLGWVLSIGAFAFEAPQRINTLIQEVYRQDTVYQNALYLYLRMAGIVWCTVEWIAAIILWRAFRFLRNTAQAKGILP